MDYFYNTAARMAKSSEILHSNNNYHNACYLGGYVVECYAKIIVSLFSTSNPRLFKHNVQGLNTRLGEILTTNTTLSNYILDGNTVFSSILNNWNPGSLRYVGSTNELTSHALSNSFQNEIKIVMTTLAKLEVDGHTLI